MPTETFRNLEPHKQRRILDAAVDEFARHGFLQASMNRVVQAVGIAKGSLFQYFGTKEGLFRFVFDHAVERVKGGLRRVREETAQADFFERMRRSLLAGVRFIDEHPDIYRIYLKMLFQENFPLRHEFLQQVHLFSARYLAPMVEQGMARGELRPDLNVKMTVFFLDAVMDRFLQAYCVRFLDAGAGLYQASEEEIQAGVAECVAVLRQGLGAEAVKPPRETETS